MCPPKVTDGLLCFIRAFVGSCRESWLVVSISGGASYVLVCIESPRALSTPSCLFSSRKRSALLSCRLVYSFSISSGVATTIKGQRNRAPKRKMSNVSDTANSTDRLVLSDNMVSLKATKVIQSNLVVYPNRVVKSAPLCGCDENGMFIAYACD